MPTRYPELTVSGSPYEMGLQLGEAARDRIRGFAEIALARVNQTVKVSSQRALEVARASFPFVRRFAPHLLDELTGMAESSGVAIDQVMLLQVRNHCVYRKAPLRLTPQAFDFAAENYFSVM